jgi:LuxR family maltose regulon positive regulatory protein
MRSAYVRRLLAELGKAVVETDMGWLEPLSDRERNVLRLLASALSGPEIAHELGVSLNTVRTHNKNIYSKLGVHNRRAAVRKAQELGLV